MKKAARMRSFGCAVVYRASIPDRPVSDLHEKDCQNAQPLSVFLELQGDAMAVEPMKQILMAGLTGAVLGVIIWSIRRGVTAIWTKIRKPK